MDSDYFQGGTAVVTGAGSGLGASMVDRFAAAGMAILALDIDAERAEEVARKVRDAGGRALAIRVDVADRRSLEAAAQAAADTFGSCTILCANAAVQQFGAIDVLTEQDWRWVLDVNVMGVVNTVSAFLPLIRKGARHRHIVVTASSASLTPGVRLGAYVTSKYAVMGYGETLRMELAEEGIGVSILFPAGMITRILDNSSKARPAEFGKSELRPADIEAMKASRKVDGAAHVASTDHATRNLLADLAANEHYIITHGAYRDSLIEHAGKILRAHDRAQGD